MPLIRRKVNTPIREEILVESDELFLKRACDVHHLSGIKMGSTFKVDVLIDPDTQEVWAIGVNGTSLEEGVKL